MASQFATSTRVLVLISGSGTNLQALIDACNTPSLPSCNIVRVISNRKDAYGLTRAQKAGIPTTYHNLVRYKKQHPQTPEGIQLAREDYDRDLTKMILDDRPQLVVMAGFMHIVSPYFVNTLADAKVPVINLHPALPGEFDGANAIGRAYEAFKKGEIKRTGVMVHYVISEVDRGEPLLTKEVEIKEEDTEEDLEKRMHQVEWGLIVAGTREAISRMEKSS